jgi:hypothetical protein
MSAPHIHAMSSAKKFGGILEDYLEIHAKMDCSKAYFPGNRYRVLTHTMFWVKEVMIPLYGEIFTNSDGKIVSTKDVCEQHILEDYRSKFIPTPQDFIENMEFKIWMQNGRGVPSSCKLLYKEKKYETLIEN